MRRFMRSLTLALLMVTGLAWSSAQTTTPNAPTYPATMAAATPDAGQPATNPLPTAQASGVRRVTVPAGTEVLLSLKNTIDTKSAHAGDDVYCQTIFPVVVDNVTVIPPGTYVKGEIARVHRAGINQRPGRGALALPNCHFPQRNGRHGRHALRRPRDPRSQNR